MALPPTAPRTTYTAADLLHVAMGYGGEAELREILSSRPQLVNAPLDRLGNTALHLFVGQNADSGPIVYLLSIGADMHIENNIGETSLDLARGGHFNLEMLAEVTEYYE